MKYQSKTDEEIASEGVMEGFFDFEIKSAREYTSDKGNETFELDLVVYDLDGTARNRKDWVTPAFAKKFKHLHSACGILDKYESGSTSSDDLIGRSGKLKMIKREYTKDDGTKGIGDRVDDYIKREGSSEKPVVAKTDALPDDGVPF